MLGGTLRLLSRLEKPLIELKVPEGDGGGEYPSLFAFTLTSHAAGFRRLPLNCDCSLKLNH